MMGARGPQKTPTKLLDKRGAWRAKERTKTEPQHVPGKPKCPASFKGQARREWNAIVKLLDSAGVLTIADGPALARYCKGWVKWLEMSADESPDPEYKRLDKEIRLSESLLKFEIQYGMTPASRPNIHRLRDKPAHGNAAKGKERFFNAG